MNISIRLYGMSLFKKIPSSSLNESNAQFWLNHTDGMNDYWSVAYCFPERGYSVVKVDTSFEKLAIWCDQQGLDSSKIKRKMRVSDNNGIVIKFVDLP